MASKLPSTENRSPNIRSQDMARRGGGILSTSFLSDSSQDSACSGGKSSSSPGVEKHTSKHDSQQPRLSSRPPSDSTSLLRPRQCEESSAIVYEDQREASAASKPCRQEGTSSARSTAQHVHHCQNGKDWPASPRDSLRPRQGAISSLIRDRDVFMCGHAASSADLHGQELGSAPRSCFASGTGGSSASSLRGRPPPVMSSSTGRSDTPSFNSTGPLLSKVPRGGTGTSLADLRAAVASLGLTAHGFSDKTINQRSKSEERLSMQTRSHRSHRSCSPRSRSPTGNTARSSSVEHRGTRSRREATPSASGRSARSARSSANLSGIHQSSVPRTGSSSEVKQQQLHDSSVVATSTELSHQRSVPSASVRIASACTRAVEMQSPKGEHFDHSVQLQSFAIRHSSSAACLQTKNATAQDRRARVGTTRSSCNSHASKPQDDTSGENPCRPTRPPRSGAASVPTPGRAPPSGFASTRLQSGGKPALATPKRGRPGTHSTSSVGSSGGSARATCTSGGTRSSMITSRDSNSAMRTSLTQRCSSLTRRLGLN